MDQFSTVSTSRDTMAITCFVIKETQITRLIFCPQWVEMSSNPLRGGFKFQRKGLNEAWVDVEHKPLSSLKKDEGYELNLDGEAMANLFQNLEVIKQSLVAAGHQFGVKKFSLDGENAEGIFLQIGQIENREWVVGQLKKLENEKFENLGSAIGRAKLENAIENFETNLGNNTESFWQNFFEEHSWILQQVFAFPVIYLNGETYLGGKNSRGRHGSGGSATDFLVKNGSNGSFAVVEIKTPKCSLVGSCYRGEEGSEHRNEIYSMHGDLTGGVVQMENQICIAIESFGTVLGGDYEDLNQLDPHGVLIAGNYSEMSEMEQKSFDLFRKSLGKNQIYTFDEVLAKLKLLKSVYEV